MLLGDRRRRWYEGQAYQIDIDAFTSKYASTKSRKRSAQRVAGCDDFVAGVLSTSACYRAQDAILSLEPGAPESGGGVAVATNCRLGGREIDIRDPVTNRS